MPTSWTVSRLGALVTSALRLIVVNAVVLLALLVPVELVFGNWIRPLGLRDLRRFSIPIDTSFEFDTSTLYTGGPRNPIHYTRDAWGFRGSYRDIREVNLVTIGGSTTDQRYLDDLATWQAVAERELRRQAHPTVIANAGVDGQSTVGHTFTLDYWLPLVPDLQPRVVLFYLGINDVMRVSDRAAFDARLDPRAWRIRSAAYQLYRTYRDNTRARVARVTHGRMRPLGPSDFTAEGLLTPAERIEIASDITQGFLENVDGLRDRVLARGARPVFVTQTAYAWSGAGDTPRGVKDTTTLYGRTVNFADISFVHQHVNRSLLDHCERTRVTCFDLAGDVAFDVDDYYDFLHNSPKGAEKIGRYVAERLASLDAGPGH